jgi:hypothetical protein
MLMRRDGDSNVTEDNLEQFAKIHLPRVETEEGIMKSASQKQREKA